MRPERKVEIERTRTEGRVAFVDGKNRQTNPYERYNMEKFQWFVGYDEAKREVNSESKVCSL